MEKINGTIKIYAQIITFLVIWGVIILLTVSISPFKLLEALKKLPQAISVYALLALLFVKWIWKWPFLKGWLIKVPNLQGTWTGELISDWINPETGKAIDPIPVVLVIRQSFLKIKCTLMTKESTSYSTTADFDCFSDTEICLAYNYTNRPLALIRDRSSIHDGATILKVIDKPKRMLVGEYWTNRKTKGEMKFTYYSTELKQQFFKRS